MTRCADLRQTGNIVFRFLYAALKGRFFINHEWLPVPVLNREDPS